MLQWGVCERAQFLTGCACLNEYLSNPCSRLYLRGRQRHGLEPAARRRRLLDLRRHEALGGHLKLVRVGVLLLLVLEELRDELAHLGGLQRARHDGLAEPPPQLALALRSRLEAVDIDAEAAVAQLPRVLFLVLEHDCLRRIFECDPPRLNQLFFPLRGALARLTGLRRGAFGRRSRRRRALGGEAARERLGGQAGGRGEKLRGWVG